MTADGSEVAYSFNHHADDNLKVDASGATYRHLTLLQGNVGAAIELGTYGLGLRANAVRGTVVSGVYLHRVAQNTTQVSPMLNKGLHCHVSKLVNSDMCPRPTTLAGAIEAGELGVPR